MRGYDAWRARGPHEDSPSVESELCDVACCAASWSAVADGYRLCERHYDDAPRTVTRLDEGEDENARDRDDERRRYDLGPGWW